MSLRVRLWSGDFSVTENILVTRNSGMSVISLPPFVSITSEIGISFDVLEDDCVGECQLVRLDQVLISLYSNGNPASVVNLREFLDQVQTLSLYKADGVGVPAKFSGIAFDSRFGGHGSKLYFPQSYSNTTVASITGCSDLCVGSSSNIEFPNSPSWPFNPSDFSSLGLLALELQPSLSSSSGSCFIKAAASTFFVTVSNGNLMAFNIMSSGSFVSSHVIVVGTNVGCASSSGPAFMSTDNQLFALVGNKFIRQDFNSTPAYFCRMLGASCVRCRMELCYFLHPRLLFPFSMMSNFWCFMG